MSIMCRCLLVCAAVLLIPRPVSGAGAGETSGPKPAVNVYSHRHYEVDQELYDLFERQTGIHVNVVQAEADELIERLRSEGSASPADVLITVDAGRLYRAKELGLLQAVSSAVLEKTVPPPLRDPEGAWWGITRRARVIVYNKERVDPARLSTYEALTAPQWHGRVLVRSSGNIYNISMLAAMIATQGEKAAREWAAGVAANFARPPRGSDRDQIRAVAAGEGDVALVNTYYLGLMQSSDDPQDRRVASKVGVFFPNQGDRGTHVNVSGIGVTASSRNRANAVRFLEFMVGEVAQRRFAEANYEYPVRDGVALAPLLASWGSFKAEEVDLSLYGRNFGRAVEIFDEVGWR